jgi:hypothetical protein
MQKTGRIKMDGRQFTIWNVLAVCVFLAATAPVFADALIVNYDNNPNLQKAMEYDLTLNSKIFFRPDGSIDIKSQLQCYDDSIICEIWGYLTVYENSPVGPGSTIWGTSRPTYSK